MSSSTSAGQIAGARPKCAKSSPAASSSRWPAPRRMRRAERPSTTAGPSAPVRRQVWSTPSGPGASRACPRRRRASSGRMREVLRPALRHGSASRWWTHGPRHARHGCVERRRRRSPRAQIDQSVSPAHHGVRQGWDRSAEGPRIRSAHFDDAISSRRNARGSAPSGKARRAGLRSYTGGRTASEQPLAAQF